MFPYCNFLVLSKYIAFEMPDFFKIESSIFEGKYYYYIKLHD